MRTPFRRFERSWRRRPGWTEHGRFDEIPELLEPMPSCVCKALSVLASMRFLWSEQRVVIATMELHRS